MCCVEIDGRVRVVMAVFVKCTIQIIHICIYMYMYMHIY